MAMNPAGLDPVKSQALDPRLALPKLIRCQTSLNSLIPGANFRNYVRGTDSRSLFRFIRHPAAPQTEGDLQHVER